MWNFMSIQVKLSLEGSSSGRPCKVCSIVLILSGVPEWWYFNLFSVKNLGMIVGQKQISPTFHRRLKSDLPTRWHQLEECSIHPALLSARATIRGCIWGQSEIGIHKGGVEWRDREAGFPTTFSGWAVSEPKGKLYWEKETFARRLVCLLVDSSASLFSVANVGDVERRFFTKISLLLECLTTSHPVPVVLGRVSKYY